MAQLFKLVNKFLVIYVNTHPCHSDCLKRTLVTASQIPSTRVSNAIHVHNINVFILSFFNREIVVGMIPYESQFCTGNKNIRNTGTRVAEC